MSKNQTHHYALRINDTGYWAGYNAITDQLRKAKLYNHVRYALTDGVEGVKRTKHPISKIEVVTVELHITEAYDITEEFTNGK